MRINLEELGRRSAIGSSARIALRGDSILPVHAKLSARLRAGTRCVELRAAGDVWVTRGTLRRLLLPDEAWVLADGDRFEIGPHILIYYNLDSSPEASSVNRDVRRATAWLNQ